MTERRRVAVVGGGIAGLSAAHALLSAHPDTIDVVVLEAQSTLGGKIRTSPFAGLAAVDEGPDAFLARVPWATQWAHRLGLGDQLVSPASGTAAVWWDGMHRIPDGLVLGLPTDIGKLARTRLISWRGKLRAATEVLRPRTSIEADSIGAFVRARFGDEVHERLVDPLVGSIYAADTDRFSLTAVPQLHDLAVSSRSVLVGARSRPAPPSVATAGPVFYAPSGGMSQFVEAAGRAIADLGGTVRTGAPCSLLEPDGARWRLDGEVFDAVVLACPATQAARLVPDPATAAMLDSIEYADVIMVTIAVPAERWPDRLRGMSGYLVPKPVQRLVTAVSFGSQKWPQWQRDDEVVLRISLGRDGRPVLHLTDQQILDAAITETGEHLGISLAPTATRITPWQRAFPQYRPHHHRMVADLEARLPATLAVAGASYHGIGIPACIRSGQRAAEVLGQTVAPVVQ
ncbi:MAG: protoporphyrinogen oxidase [Ilumatobacteraceae bacterium]